MESKFGEKLNSLPKSKPKTRGGRQAKRTSRPGKGKAKAKAKGKAEANSVTKKILKKPSAAKVFDDLVYKPPCKGKSKPRFYGTATIYTDLVSRVWRCKPAPGRRDETRFRFQEPKSWSKLVAHVKALPQY